MQIYGAPIAGRKMMKGNKLMDTITLIEPTMEYEKDIWLFRQELLDADDKDSFAGCSELETCQTAKEWIDDINLRKSEKTCPEDRVPSHVYLAVRKADHKIVGITDLRHHIDHPILGTCDENNTASEKTILACGGVFEKNIEVDGSMIKRYWITISY